jgi:hypothetical protein
MRSAPFAVFAFAMLFPIAMIMIGGGAAVWLWLMKRALKSKQALDVSDLTPGYSLVWGKVARNSQRAPLTDRPCAWYSIRVEELGRNETGPERRLQWKTVRNETSNTPIELTDGKATCFVDVAGAKVIESGWSEWAGPHIEPDEPEPEIHPGPRSPGVEASVSVSVLGDIVTAKYRCRERYIFAGDPLFATGDAEPAASKLLLDDSDELESGPGNQDFVADTLLVRKPKGAGPYTGARPFIVSTEHPKDVAAESQLAVQGGLVLVTIGVVVGLLLLNIRYG